MELTPLEISQAVLFINEGLRVPIIPESAALQGIASPGSRSKHAVQKYSKTVETSGNAGPE